MQFRIDPAILTRFPETKLTVLLCTSMANPPSSDTLKASLLAQTEMIRATFTLESLLADPHIARWRTIYPQFGAKPRDYRSSIEALGRRCVNGKGLPNISSLVDSYNLISLKYLLTAGGEDLDRIKGDIELTIATDHEPPTLLLGDHEPQAPFAGEIIYKDDVSAICRCWNWREADRTKLTPETTRCVLVLEDLSHDWSALKTASEELACLIKEHCGGAIKTFFLDRDTPTCSL